VMFRNTRAAMAGFPKRKFIPHPLDAENNLAQLARIARELETGETGEAAGSRYSFKEDSRIDWLVGFLRQHRATKVLLICTSPRKVVAIDAALQEKMKVKSGLFHEGLPLVQRDRNAAWFAEPDGAQLLICSEIGSEGRNFQFAHHLVLFDLPLNPGLIEQRIGRLDRIGQTETIRIHVPYVAGSAEEAVVEWYHRGLDAFETSLQGGNDYEEKFKSRLLALALAYGGGDKKVGQPQLEAFIAETAEFRRALAQKLKQGRDRLLELHSFDREAAAAVIARVRAADSDPALKNFLLELLDHFGVRVKDHEEGDVFLDPSHAYIEAFPSIPHDGMLATFDRRRAIVREDIRFISPDHSLVQDAIDLLVDSKAGTTAFGFIRSPRPNLILEAVFVLETVADARWQVDRFLAPTPIRAVVDVRGDDLTAARPAAGLADDFEDGVIQRFLERPGFNLALLKTMLDSATAAAEQQIRALKTAAETKASTILSAELQRLVDLRQINDHVRPEEIELARQQLQRTTAAIAEARLRLDSIRLIVEGPDVARD
jgi:ATP-dependent helicase HepA